MVTRKLVIVAGTVLIGIVSTLLVCSESPKKPCHECKKEEGGMSLKLERERPDLPQDASPPFIEGKPRPPKSDQELIEFLEKFDPERLEWMKHLKEMEPDTYFRVLEETKREMMKLKELRERDPERFEQIMIERRMETEIKELSSQYRKSQDSEEKEGLKKQIKAKLEKLFDLREKQREAEIKRIEQELTKLKEKMKIRKANRDKIIERRQKELLGEEDDLGW
jgi:hypothetical protein